MSSSPFARGGRRADCASGRRSRDRLGIPVVASAEARCIHRSDNTMLHTLASIGTLTLIDRPHPDKPEGLWHLRTAEEMQHLFAHGRTHAEHARHRRGVRPASRSVAEPVSAVRKSRTGVPRSSIFGRSAWRAAGGDTWISRLTRESGACGPHGDEVTARLERELRIIEQVQYAEYFLVFHEIVQYCNREGISTLAPGSAADSLVCYAIGVSQACPFRFDLPFDRFVNAERAKFSRWPTSTWICRGISTTR